MIESLQKYFQGIADDISNSKNTSSIFPNMGDLGDVRENVLLQFLKTHLPARCSVFKGGCIFDSSGNISNQIDLLICSDAAVRFSYFDRDSQNSKTVQTVEGCLAAISVKSTLSKDTLYEALNNLDSIPVMPKYVIQNMSPLLQEKEYVLKFPLRIIFALSSESSTETILKNIDDFYRDKKIDDCKKPTLIISNNQFSISKIGPKDGKTRDGNIIPAGTFFPEHNTGSKFGDFPLFRLIVQIQQAAQWVPHMIIDYAKYIDAFSFKG